MILTYALVSPIAGWLGDRRARLPIAAAGVLVWSVATFGSGFAPTLAVFLLMRALVGVGEASYAVVTPPVLSDYYSAADRPRALSVFYAAIPLGSAVGFALGVLGQHLGLAAGVLHRRRSRRPAGSVAVLPERSAPRRARRPR